LLKVSEATKVKHEHYRNTKRLNYLLINCCYTQLERYATTTTAKSTFYPHIFSMPYTGLCSPAVQNSQVKPEGLIQLWYRHMCCNLLRISPRNPLLILIIRTRCWN